MNDYEKLMTDTFEKSPSKSQAIELRERAYRGADIYNKSFKEKRIELNSDPEVVSTQIEDLLHLNHLTMMYKESFLNENSQKFSDKTYLGLADTAQNLKECVESDYYYYLLTLLIRHSIALGDNKELDKDCVNTPKKVFNLSSQEKRLLCLFEAKVSDEWLIKL